MTKIFAFFAPPFTFTKDDLYSSSSSNPICPFIKAVSDCFFLSNHFRHDYDVYFFTTLNSLSYVIVFRGQKIRYLGPSYFSAAHLLLRAINFLGKPRSRTNKLTPGLSIYPFAIDDFLSKHKDKTITALSTNPSFPLLASFSPDSLLLSDLFLFNFPFSSSLSTFDVFSCPHLCIDEQVIFVNYLLDKGDIIV